MSTPAPSTSWVDLHFLGRPHVIATAVIGSAGRAALVDPGPSTCLSRLERELEQRGLRFDDITHLLLTHIHLDHAGASGTLVGRFPHLQVLVHESGARHLADPAKLIESATRLYGADMGRLWGAIDPVPRANLHTLNGGERLEVGGTHLQVAYTPGHASHHVSYLDESTGIAFVGDTAGVRIEGGYVLPPTPPPDIDLELWRGSLDRIEAWAPSTLFLTHFGPYQDVAPHLQAMREHLSTVAALVRESLEKDLPDPERRRYFTARLSSELRRHYTDEQVVTYDTAAPFEMLWLGLARYLRKTAERAQTEPHRNTPGL